VPFLLKTVRIVLIPGINLSLTNEYGLINMAHIQAKTGRKEHKRCTNGEKRAEEGAQTVHKR